MTKFWGFVNLVILVVKKVSGTCGEESLDGFLFDSIFDSCTLIILSVFLCFLEGREDDLLASIVKKKS